MYSQHDGNYSRIRLGTSSRTIGQDGCLLCAMATAINTHGKEMNPPRLNRWLCKHNGFTDDNRFVFNSVEPLGLRCVLVADYRNQPANLDELRRYIAGGYVVLVAVNFNPYSRYNEHWLLACGFVHDDLECLDPWVDPADNPIVGVLLHYARPTWSLADAIYRLIAYDFDERIAGRTAF